MPISSAPPAAGRFAHLERETRMQAWVAAKGYAPPLLDLLPPGELFESLVQVMKRLPGITMADAMAGAHGRGP
jgi:hypothetical protein